MGPPLALMAGRGHDAAFADLDLGGAADFLGHIGLCGTGETKAERSDEREDGFHGRDSVPNVAFRPSFHRPAGARWRQDHGKRTALPEDYS
jgi:hypothetical protein